MVKNKPMLNPIIEVISPDDAFLLLMYMEGFAAYVFFAFIAKMIPRIAKMNPRNQKNAKEQIPIAFAVSE